MKDRPTRYRVQCELKGAQDVGAHVLRWFVLSALTAGIALIFYPFYFVRFMAGTLTFVEDVDMVVEDPPPDPKELSDREAATRDSLSGMQTKENPT